MTMTKIKKRKRRPYKRRVPVDEFVRLFNQGLSDEEIASATGYSVNSICSIASRIRKQQEKERKGGGA